MLNPVMAHQGEPLAPHHLWTEWNIDPFVVVVLATLAFAVVRARSRRRDRRAASEFWAAVGALVALAIALISPLDALSHALVSAHMVQHLVLMMVAAPLLAVAVPARSFALGIPRGALRRFHQVRRRPTIRTIATGLMRPAPVFLAFAAALWAWHSAALYDAAVRIPLVHLAEHATFLGAATLFWTFVVTAARNRGPSAGTAGLLVFTTALHTVVLSALLTFAPTPWYGEYAATTPAWNLTPLADQQLAGAIMWVPGGLIYAATALFLVAAWVRQTEAPPAMSVTN